MATAQSILSTLKTKGAEKTRITYARHGTPIDRALGVSVADLKTIAKTIKGEQTLALELYKTGFMEAMYLAGIVANGAKMSRAEIQSWAENTHGIPMIAEYTVPWVTVEHPDAVALATKWIASKDASVASVGWSTMSGLASITDDTTLNLTQLQALLDQIVAKIAKAPNRVKYNMNSFIICVGAYVKPLSNAAKKAAKQIGPVSVNMGDTACEVPLATDYIAKIEASGRAGKKRKTIRC